MDLAAACEDLFKRNRAEAFGGHFHTPCVDEYPCLFAWDSGYHALALRHLDRAAAIEELRTLYLANTTEEGLLAHERPLPKAIERTQFVVETIGPIYRPDFKSWLIDPPVAAFAAAELFDPGLDDLGLIEAASAHLAAIDQTRTVMQAGLPAILHPLESGTDASPLFDTLLDVSSHNAYVVDLHELSHALADCGGLLERAQSAQNRFIVSDPVFCGWHLLALEALASAWVRSGNLERALPLQARAKAFAQQMHNRLWSERHSLFVGYDHVQGRQLDTPTLGGVIAAASTNVIELGLADRMMSHLHKDSSSFWGAAGIAFNPLASEVCLDEGLLWRGPVASGATHYWGYLAAASNGAHGAAKALRDHLAALIEASAFREFYDARSGAGLGVGLTGGFTWPALILAMNAAS